MRLQRLAPWILASSGALLLFLALPWGGASARTGQGEAAPDLVPAPPEPPAPPLGEIRFDAASQRYVAPMGDRQAVLTLEPRLQKRLERVLSDHRVPWGATVLIEPRTGRVLAMAQHSRLEPGATDLPLRAMAPAASIFKIVTSAALLARGIEPDEEVCYHGGRHRLAPGLLQDNPRRDRRCVTLANALGKSTNVVFAKLADRDLSAELLRAEADRFLFNRPIPFARPVEVSKAEIPDDDFERAATAAGFGAVKLSALHGAVLASIVANGGVFVAPQLVATVEGGEPAAPAAPQRVLDERIARVLGEMMHTTQTEGTARKVYRRIARGRSPLREVEIAGKTGSLAGRDPYRDYSWFVGFAPLDDPQIAVASVVVNELVWHVKAPYVAHDALAAYFAGEWGVRTAQAAGAR